MTKKYFTVALILLGITFYGCNSKAKMSAKPTVVVSILPLKYFVEQLADSMVQVKVLVPPGSGPEMYEPTPAQLVDLSAANIYFSIGLLDFEKGLEPKLRGNYPVKYINLSEGARLIRGDDSHAEEVEESHHHGVDPHIWLSAIEAKRMAGVMLKALQAAYPNQKSALQANFDRFAARIDSVNTVVSTVLESMKSKSFLIYHPALSYFARDYSLKQLSIEAEGKSPSVNELVGTVKMAKELGIRTVLSQSQFDIHNAQVIADEIGGRVVKVDPLAENWCESMVQIANALAGE